SGVAIESLCRVLPSQAIFSFAPQRRFSSLESKNLSAIRIRSDYYLRTANTEQRRKKMKILMVLTSHDQQGNTGRKTGFWLEEFAAPYFVFKEAGVELTLASPKGGQPPVDPKSDLPENQTPAMARFKEDPAAQKALSQTVKLADAKAEDY